MQELEYSESVVVARSPEDVYDMVADVTRMGEWSPECKACWWDDGAVPEVGAWFTGRNQLADYSWEARCQVVAAERGSEFAWIVGGNRTRWGYTFTPVEDGTRLTESWELLPAGVESFEERFGDDAPAIVAHRYAAMRAGMTTTLAAIKRAAEMHG